MKRKTFRLITPGVVAVAVLVLPACATDAATNTGDDIVTIRVVNAFPETDLLTQGYVALEKALRENSKTIRIESLGGSEVVANFELGAAVRDGVIDAFVAPNYHLDIIPEARSLVMSELTIQEEIDSGGIDFLNTLHNERMNSQLIGRLSTTNFSYYLRDSVDDVADFQGLKLRGSPGHIPLANVLGYDLQQIPGGELYTALERGAVDGFAWGSVGTTDSAFHEQISYRISPSFWNMDVVMVMNLDVWNGLTPEQQEEFMAIFSDVQKELPAITQEYVDDEAVIFDEAGIETIDLGEGLRDSLSEGSWAWMRANEANVEEYESLFRY